MAKDPKKAQKAAQLWATSPEYRQKSRNRKKAWYARQKELNLGKLQAKYRCYRFLGKMKKQENYLIKKYGLNWAAFNELMAQQDNCCAICKKPLDEYSKTRVDHCHTTGKVRGILCHGCNVGLGYFYDNVSSLRAAADYLEKCNDSTREIA